jgi:hypothetical protein
VTNARRPRRRDSDDLFSSTAALFAMLPPWSPLVALAVGDSGVTLAFSAFHWPIAYRPLALMAVTVFIGISGIAGLVERVRRLRRLARSMAIDDLRAMSSTDFEHLVMSAYDALGWSASLTQRGADGGADVISSAHTGKSLCSASAGERNRLACPRSGSSTQSWLPNGQRVGSSSRAGRFLPTRSRLPQRSASTASAATSSSSSSRMRVVTVQRRRLHPTIGHRPVPPVHARWCNGGAHEVRFGAARDIRRAEGSSTSP